MRSREDRRGCKIISVNLSVIQVIKLLSLNKRGRDWWVEQGPDKYRSWRRRNRKKLPSAVADEAYSFLQSKYERCLFHSFFSTADQVKKVFFILPPVYKHIIRIRANVYLFPRDDLEIITKRDNLLETVKIIRKL